MLLSHFVGQAILLSYRIACYYERGQSELQLQYHFAELLDQCRTYEDGGSSEELIKRCLNFFVQTFSTRTGSSSGTSEHTSHGRVYVLSAQPVRSQADTSKAVNHKNNTPWNYHPSSYVPHNMLYVTLREQQQASFQEICVDLSLMSISCFFWQDLYCT